MISSKFSICILIAFALFNIVFTDHDIEALHREKIPWNDTQFQIAFQQIIKRFPSLKIEIVKEGNVFRKIHDPATNIFYSVFGVILKDASEHHFSCILLIRYNPSKKSSSLKSQHCISVIVPQKSTVTPK